jgi:hypothetical protein
MKIKELRVNNRGDFDILISFSKKDVSKLTEWNSDFRMFMTPEHIERLYQGIISFFFQNKNKFIKELGFGNINFSKIQIKCDEHDVFYPANEECPVCIAQSKAKRKES